MRYLFLLLVLTTFSACSGDASDSTEESREQFAGEAATPPPAELPYRNVSPEDFAELMGRADALLLDVRTTAEVAGGQIDGAINVDYRDPNFATLLADLPTDKTYLIYCAGGGRSAKTCEMLAERGYDQLVNLEGGYRAWVGE